jgi:hypothetical protein
MAFTIYAPRELPAEERMIRELDEIAADRRHVDKARQHRGSPEKCRARALRALATRRRLSQTP